MYPFFISCFYTDSRILLYNKLKPIHRFSISHKVIFLFKCCCCKYKKCIMKNTDYLIIIKYSYNLYSQ